MGDTCKKHREEIIDVCIQPGCTNLVCDKCKTTIHKGHDTLILSDYKEKCLAEIEGYESHLKVYASDLTSFIAGCNSHHLQNGGSNKNVKVEETVGSSTRCHSADKSVQGAEPLLQSLMQQNRRVKDALKCTEDALDPFLIDQLSSLPIIQEAYDKILEVYKKDHILQEAVSDTLALSHPQVKIDCGLSAVNRSTVKVFHLCRNEDIVFAGEDVIEQKWRIRRFNRLGRLVWNKPLPLSWASVDGIAEYHRDRKSYLLLSNADEGKIVMTSEKKDNFTICYSDEKRAPEAMCLTPDCRAFVKDRSRDHDGGQVILLNTESVPFQPIRNFSLGFNFPSEMAYLEGNTECLIVTSHTRKVIKAIDVVDGSPIWSLGPVAAGRELNPYSVCTSADGKGLE